MISFKEITKDNVVSVMKLKVLDHQDDQVAPNAFSIAQSHYHHDAWIRAIYNDEEPVGFVMLYLDDEEKEYGVWRFMIDGKHQKKGYGKAAMEIIKKVVKEEAPEASGIGLSYVPKEKGGADEFYRKVGFEDTGKMLGDEKIMLYKY